MEETMFGITWATKERSVCQTGYVYPTRKAAGLDARLGPVAVRAKGIQVEPMVDDDEAAEGTRPLYGLVQDEDNDYEEYEVSSAPVLS